MFLSTVRAASHYRFFVKIFRKYSLFRHGLFLFFCYILLEVIYMFFVYNKTKGLSVFSHKSLKKCMKYVSDFYDKTPFVIFSVDFAGGRCLLSEVSYFDSDEQRFRSSNDCIFLDLDFFWDPDFDESK